MTVTNPVVAPYPQIIFLGDSIVCQGSNPGGYIAQLSSKYAGKMDVLNRGMPGYTSKQVATKLREDFYTTNSVTSGTSSVKLLVLHVGTNDCVTHGIQHVDVPTFKASLVSIIEHFRSAHSAKVILITPSTCQPEVWTSIASARAFIESEAHNRTVHSAKKYAVAALEVGQQLQVPVVDAFTTLAEPAYEGTASLDDFFYDGLHYTAKGYALITSQLEAAIDKNYPELSARNLPEYFPCFAEYQQEGNDPAVSAQVAEVYRRIQLEVN